MNALNTQTGGNQARGNVGPGRATRMYREAGEAAGVVAAQLVRNAPVLAALGARLRAQPPRAVVTCARGSSDHAATYARYLVEAHTPALTSSAAPSLSSIYDASTDLRETLFIAISQSGRSPDLLAATAHARARGALTVALCNTSDAPLMQSVDVPVPLHAGSETSVAATKSYIASLSCIAQLVASWTQQLDLSEALAKLPSQLERAWACDWSAGVATLRDAVNLFVVARGFGLAIAQEAALKLKETCGLHAEAFSAAEVRHGPMALVRAGFPVLMFAQDDESRAGVEQAAAEFAARGAKVLLAGGRASGAVCLPSIVAHPVIEPILAIQSFYAMANDLSVARGLDPDRPPHLAKVTETV
ncbi:MAG TPA: SIS domain-containing protein [Steroidobacteraceae bacterium]|nr:SIS domain-containing protein [Steroidobacteraceae bacterium]